MCVFVFVYMRVKQTLLNVLITDIFQGVMGTQEEKHWPRTEVPHGSEQWG